MTSLGMTGPRKMDSLEPRWVVYRVQDSQQPWFRGVSSLLAHNPMGVKLLPRDFAVFVAVLDRINWRAAPRCEYTLAALAEEIAMDPKSVIKSVGRLKRSHVLATGVDHCSGKRYILVNPTYAYSGDPRRRYVAEQEWVALWKEDHPGEEILEAEELQERIEATNRSVDARNRNQLALAQAPA